MNNNPVLLARYARSLHQQLSNQTCVNCVSSSLTDISLLFSNGFYLNIQFLQQHTLFLNPKTENFPQRGVLPQFKSLVGLKVAAVHSYFPDRSLGIEFNHNKQLFIQAYGRHNGICLANQNEVVDFFKFNQAPEHFEEPKQEIDLKCSQSEFLSNNRFVNEEMLSELENRVFFESDELERTKIWKRFLIDLEQRQIFIGKTQSSHWKMSLFPIGETDQSFENVIKAQHEFAKLTLAEMRFEILYEKLYSMLTAKHKASLKTFNNGLIRLQKMPKALTLKQNADVIMANLYLITPGTTSVELYNFYTEKQEVFKLKKDMSAQENAAALYRKSKSTHLEIAHVEAVVEKSKQEVSKLENQLAHLKSIDNYKELAAFQKSLDYIVVKGDTIKALPYKSFEKDGFTIWVGRSAQANDDLLKLAGKNDTWLHAREVSGSHVLIRNAENKKIGEEVLEYAASLAAGHSKNQHESLAAVIYTPVKYVRKFKKSHPGQVRVDREEVILVEPRKS